MTNGCLIKPGITVKRCAQAIGRAYDYNLLLNKSLFVPIFGWQCPSKCLHLVKKLIIIKLNYTKISRGWDEKFIQNK